MIFGKSMFDLAERRTEEEREASIKAASRALQAKGTLNCEDCPREIPHARRLAIPSATRCVHCQTLHEQNVKGCR